MPRTPLSGAKLEDVFGPFDKNVRRTPHTRRQTRDAAKRYRPDFKIEALENREVPAIDVTAAATSLASTAGSNAAIGEIVRVRAVVQLQGDGGTFDPNAYTVSSTLAPGLKYMDGTARIALISDGGITSTLGGAAVNGSSANGVTPTFGITPILSNGQLVFGTGISAIGDNDANAEYAVIEYNALVENVLPNQAGTQLTVGFALSAATAGSDNGSMTATVVEPSITDLLKNVNRTTARQGDTVTYTLTFSNAASAATAYNLAVLDTVPNGLQLNTGSVVVVGGTGVVNRSTASSVAIEIDSLAAGASVTISYTALVTAAAGVTLNSAAQVQYTSLPGTNGETQNPTGSVTPGNGAATDGERKGCGCGAPGLNNYRDDDDAPLTVQGGPGGPNSISGVVFGDTNENGSFDAGDALLEGVIIDLYDSATGQVIATQFTDASGAYTFSNLPDGTYDLDERDQPPGYNDGMEFVGTAGGVTGPNNGLGTDYIDGITVAGGTQATGYLFGECPCDTTEAQLSGYVFVDNNDNCAFDAGDLAIPGVTLTLTGTTLTGGTVNRTTTTDANGFYQFTGLLAGTYTVTQTQPTEFNGVPLVDGCDTAGSTGGTVGPNNGRGTDTISTIRIIGGDNSVNNNFGEVPNAPHEKGSLSGHVYFDANCNCVFDAGDTPISGVTVNLLNSLGQVVATTTTNANGEYVFTDLDPGEYRVEQVQPATNNQGVPLVDGCDKPGTGGGTVGPNNGVGTDFITSIVVTGGQNAQNNDFYECPAPTPEKGSLSGHVFFDANCNCVFDAGDAPISGVTVNLLNSLGQVVATTTTNANGEYVFTDLDPGEYRVEQVQPATNNQGVPLVDGCDKPGTGGGTVGPNQGVGTDFITGIAVVANGNAANNDFYECPQPVVTPGSISGFVFCYTGTGTNVRTVLSTPIPGVIVTLNGVTNAGAVINLSTTTNAAGQYTFSNLAPGTYTVRQVQPPQNILGAGIIVTDGDDSIEIVGGTNTVTPQNDVHPGIVVTGPSTVQTFFNFGEMCTPAGLSGNSALDGYVYLDANRNCVYDRDAAGNPINGDLPIQGVVMYLTGTTAAGVAVNRQAVTNEVGFYRFTDLDPGTYTVTQTQPTSFVLNGVVFTLGDFCENPGTTGGTTGPNNGIGTSNQIVGIPIPADFTESNQNNFGEVIVNVTPGPNPLPPINKGQLLSSTPGAGTGGTGVGGVTVIGTAAQSPTFTNSAGRLGNGNPNAVRYLVTGTDVGGGPFVRVFDFQTGVERAAFYAYDQSFTGGVRVASADVTGDGIADVITAAGVGGGPHIRVFDGVSFQMIREFMAYDASFRGGVYLAAADVTGDGIAEIVTGAGEGGAAHVKVFNTVGQFAEFFAYDTAFRGGVRVAAADFNADGRADIATGAGIGGGPHVKVFDLAQPAADSFALLSSFMAFDANFRGGVFVSANNTSGNGDATGDGRPDLVVGAGTGGQALVNVYNGVNFSLYSQFLAYDASFTGGVRVGLLDANGDGRADVIAGTGSGKGAFVRLVDLVSTKDLEFFQAYTPAYLGGVFVAGA